MNLTKPYSISSVLVDIAGTTFANPQMITK